MALYEAVLNQNGLDADFIQSLHEGGADSASDDEDDDVEVASVASTAGDEAGPQSQAVGDAPESSTRGDTEGEYTFLAVKSSNQQLQNSLTLLLISTLFTARSLP